MQKPWDSPPEHYLDARPYLVTVHVRLSDLDIHDLRVAVGASPERSVHEVVQSVLDSVVQEGTRYA